MYRIWEKLPSGNWVPLELACRDKNFISEVMVMYAKHFEHGDPVSLSRLEIREDDEEYDTWHGMDPQVTAEMAGVGRE